MGKGQQTHLLPNRALQGALVCLRQDRTTCQLHLPCQMHTWELWGAFPSHRFGSSGTNLGLRIPPSLLSWTRVSRPQHSGHREPDHSLSWAGGGGCPVRGRMLSHIPGLHPLDASSTLPPPIMTTTNVPRYR